MKAKFTVSQEEMVIYKGALRDKLIVTLPGVEGKHLMNDLEVEVVGDDEFELTVNYGKRRKAKDDKDKGV